MTIRHLKIFVTVCQTNSVTRAAEKLYISQPAVSLAIKELEEHYGQKIFERFARKLRITPLGQELYQSALRIVTMFDEMESAAGREKLGNVIRVGVGPMIGQVMLPERVCRFREKHPQIQISALVDRVIYLRRALIENRIDFAIAESVFEDPMIRTIPLLAVPLVVICHKDNPLARQEVVTAQDLEKQPILARQVGSFLRTSMDNFFAAHNISVVPMWESSDGFALLSAVKANVGISFLASDHVLFVNDPNIVILNVKDFSATYYMNAYTHKDKVLTPFMQEFIDDFVDSVDQP